MVETLKQVKFTTNTKPATEIKKDTPKTTHGASNLERTPEKDEVSVKGKEKTTGNKKSLTGWLIGVGAAVIGVGIYFLTRGKKGTKAVTEAGKEAAQNVKKGVNEAVQKVEDAVSTVAKKEEPKVKAKETPTSPKPKKEPDVKKQETLTPDKITVPEKQKPKPNPKEELKKDAQTVKIEEEVPTPHAPAQTKVQQPTAVKQEGASSVAEIMQQAGLGNKNILDTSKISSPSPKPVKNKTQKQKVSITELKETPKTKEPIKENIQEPKKETVKTPEQKLPETSKDKINKEEEFFEDGIAAAALFGDDVAAGAGKKVSQFGDDLVEEASDIFGKKINDPVSEIKPHSYEVENPYSVTDDIVNNPWNKATDDIVNPDDDYFNKLADDVFDYNPTNDYSSGLTDYADDVTHFDDVVDSFDDFLDF